MKTKSRTLYPHPFSKAYWRDAAAELKDVRMLVFAALMIALRVAMKGLYIPLGPTLKINTAFVVNALGAMVFGPVVAIPAAVVSDFLGFILWPQTGPYFLPYVFIEVAGSLIFALFLYRAKVTPARVILSRFCIDLFVNIIFNAPITALYYKMMLGKPYVMFQIPHILKNLLMFPVESVILTLFLSALLPITNRMGLTYPVPGSQDAKLRFSKKQVALMVCLFLVAGIVTVGYVDYYYDTTSVSADFSKQERYDYNCEMNDIVRAQTDDWDDRLTAAVVEAANLEIYKGNTKYTVAVYTVDEEVMAQNLEEMKAENPDAVYDLDTIRGYSKSPAAKDTALTRVATATILVNNKTREVKSFAIK